MRLLLADPKYTKVHTNTYTAQSAVRVLVLVVTHLKGITEHYTLLWLANARETFTLECRTFPAGLPTTAAANSSTAII
jgi:hypothetical protein